MNQIITTIQSLNINPYEASFNSVYEESTIPGSPLTTANYALLNRDASALNISISSLLSQIQDAVHLGDS